MDAIRGASLGNPLAGQPWSSQLFRRLPDLPCVMVPPIAASDLEAEGQASIAERPPAAVTDTMAGLMNKAEMVGMPRRLNR